MRLQSTVKIADGHEEDERQDLGGRQEERRARPRLDPDDVQPGQQGEREDDRRDVAQAVVGAVPDVTEHPRKEDGETRDGGHTRHPGHPADLESDELAERLAGVDVGPARTVEEARRLGEAEDDQEDGETSGEDRPDAGRSEQLRRRHRQDEVDAAPDDAVDGEGEDLQTGNGAQKPRSRRGGGGQGPDSSRAASSEPD